MVGGDAASRGSAKEEATWRLALPNVLERVGEANGSLEAFLQGHGVTPGVVFSVGLVFEEVVTNVIKYSYADTGPHEIVAEASIGPEDIVLRVTDDGRAFDPRTAPPPDFDLPIECRAVGGLGIHLVRRLTRRVDYSRTSGKNVLTLFLPLAPGETEGQSS